ncbi:hypothetical protein [Pedobacter faecalis]|uniref:hypothetical protein n=1 Tax=Pedobacter faecalis TaxID=3041495 RepID=UPI002550B5B5|nr:hypothetical protein [Pedobacter sp. ELA7]
MTLTIVLLIAAFVLFFLGRRPVKNYTSLVSVPKADILMQLYDLRCETFISGVQRPDLNFKKCDLVITHSAVLVFGYSGLMKHKLYVKPLIFHKAEAVPPYHSGLHIVPKKINPHSIGNTVYIMFEVAGFMTATIDLRIFDVPEEARERMSFLEVPG